MESPWKGDLATNRHTPYRDSTARPVFAGGKVATGFSGTCRDEQSEILAARWQAPEASVFARHCAGQRVFDGVPARAVVHRSRSSGHRRISREPGRENRCSHN